MRHRHTEIAFLPEGMQLVTLKHPICDNELSVSDYVRIGWFFAHRARRLARRKGVMRAAMTLKSRGVPLQVALVMLAKRRT